jgi:iron donor protein CyaY
MMTMDESAYRQRVDEVFRRIDAAFENVDPDLAESDYAQGTLVVTFRQAHKLILSPQTPLRQIWMAFRDRAWHFALAETSGQPETWTADRGQGMELLTLITELARENASVQVAF